MMDRYLIFATWNLCLGLPNKKDIVIDTLKRNDIALCALQETEIFSDFPVGALNCGDYNLELEKNTTKKACKLENCTPRLKICPLFSIFL